MARFEQQICEADIKAARERIAGGVSLRSAAAAIPCSPSTLSVRIKKAEAAEAAASSPSTNRSNELRAAQGTAELPDAHASAAGDGVRVGDVGPLEILRGALLATKADGRADWPTRVSAARALAALRPEELEPKQTHQPVGPSIVVYDLPDGAEPVTVLHRATDGLTHPSSDSEASPQQLISSHRDFLYEPADGEFIQIGSWKPPAWDEAGFVTIELYGTRERETAERWLAELAAGQLPTTTGDAP